MTPAPFSIPWKNPPKFFHTVENFPKIFPYRGKNLKNISILWKIPEIFFHTVENSARRPQDRHAETLLPPTPARP